MMNLILAFLVFHFQKSRHKYIRKMEYGRVLLALKEKKVKRSNSISFAYSNTLKSIFGVYSKDDIDQDSDSDRLNRTSHNLLKKDTGELPVRCINTDKFLAVLPKRGSINKTKELFNEVIKKYHSSSSKSIENSMPLVKMDTRQTKRNKQEYSFRSISEKESRENSSSGKSLSIKLKIKKEKNLREKSINNSKGVFAEEQIEHCEESNKTSSHEDISIDNVAQDKIITYFSNEKVTEQRSLNLSPGKSNIISINSSSRLGSKEIRPSKTISQDDEGEGESRNLEESISPNPSQSIYPNSIYPSKTNTIKEDIFKKTYDIPQENIKEDFIEENNFGSSKTKSVNSNKSEEPNDMQIGLEIQEEEKRPSSTNEIPLMTENIQTLYFPKPEASNVNVNNSYNFTGNNTDIMQSIFKDNISNSWRDDDNKSNNNKTPININERKYLDDSNLSQEDEVEFSSPKEKFASNLKKQQTNGNKNYEENSSEPSQNNSNGDEEFFRSTYNGTQRIIDFKRKSKINNGMNKEQENAVDLDINKLEVSENFQDLSGFQKHYSEMLGTMVFKKKSSGVILSDKNINPSSKYKYKPTMERNTHSNTFNYKNIINKDFSSAVIKNIRDVKEDDLKEDNDNPENNAMNMENSNQRFLSKMVEKERNISFLDKIGTINSKVSNQTNTDNISQTFQVKSKPKASLRLEKVYEKKKTEYSELTYKRQRRFRSLLENQSKLDKVFEKLDPQGIHLVDDKIIRPGKLINNYIVSQLQEEKKIEAEFRRSTNLMNRQALEEFQLEENRLDVSEDKQKSIKSSNKSSSSGLGKIPYYMESNFWMTYKDIMKKVDDSLVFNTLVYVTIAIGVINLMLMDPRNDPDQIFAKVIKIIDYFVSWLFLFEMIVKISARGLWRKGKRKTLDTPTPNSVNSLNRISPVRQGKNYGGFLDIFAGDSFKRVSGSTGVYNSIFASFKTGQLEKKEPYLMSLFNWLDMTVTVTNIVHFFYMVTHESSSEDAIHDKTYYLITMNNLMSLKAVRLLVAIVEIKSLLIVGKCIIKSVITIVNMFILGITFIFIFSLITTTYFKGLLGTCSISYPTELTNNIVKANMTHYVYDPNVIEDINFLFYGQETSDFGKIDYFYSENDRVPFNEIKNEILTADECTKLHGTWTRSTFNFDTLSNALIVLFETATLEGWVEIMFKVIQGTNRFTSFFFIFYIIIACIFIMNLSVCAIVDNFIHVNEAKEGLDMLNDSHKDWLKLMKIFLKRKPEKIYSFRKDNYKKKIHSFLITKKFKYFINALILINSINYLLDTHRSPQMYKDFQSYIFYFCTCLFNVEFLLKVIAYEKKYFKDRWNVYDFIMIHLSNISILVNIFYYFFEKSLFEIKFSDFQFLPVLIRGMRIFMYFRIVKVSKSLREYLYNMYYMLHSMANIGFLVLLNLLIYAIIGNVLFSTLKHGAYVNRNTNFSNIFHSIMLLVRCNTGEDWQKIMHEVGARDLPCYDYQSFSHLEEFGPQGCGSFIAYPFFVTFIILNYLIFMNLFIAVVVDSFLTNDLDSVMKRIDDNIINKFFSSWTQYDTNSNLWIDPPSCALLLLQLQDSLNIELDMPKYSRQQPISKEIYFSYDRKYIITWYQCFKLLERFNIDCVEGKIHIIDVIRLLVGLYQKKYIYQEAYYLENDGPDEIKSHIQRMYKDYDNQYIRSFYFSDCKEQASDYFAKQVIYRFMKKSTGKK
eukprot:CAMPEP_0170538770 /NCGR_PEP_ID=MMETSP0209-20121228/103514_1 /TAXON_ID=665100 ORGANISM="Litonotus pictus, Strain P1" /NCGR_SAMPLE_ID=MMETSP0209 /ASSEMBLY_ACC=CAM_ASM_000301 /LENGTH=1710 /DNA_ID=CAMNT_0010840535 /DNA_START=2177 /DNA_END=7309 /DNA_ORIENTATION=-